jgi:hypothetical protein
MRLPDAPTLFGTAFVILLAATVMIYSFRMP